MKRFLHILILLLAGSSLWTGFADSASAQQPGPGMGGRGRGWGAQMRRAQMAQQAEQSSTSAKASSSIAMPAGCAGCCMMGFNATTPQGMQMQPSGNQTSSATQIMGMGRGMGRRMGMGQGMGMGGPGPRLDMAEAMPVIHGLLAQHKQIRRTVENIPQGIRTETTSIDLEVAAQIRKHVGQMKKRLEQGQPMRMWDPLFRELFRNAGKIKMTVEDISGGVRVTETSADPQTVLLIQQHAQAVLKFVEKGMAAAHEAHELPAGYKPQ